MELNLSKDQIGGIKREGLQSYKALIRDLGPHMADPVRQVPHRRLTYLERAALEGIFAVVDEHLGEALDQVAEMEDPKDPKPRTLLDQVLDFAEAYATLAYLAGEQEGFRLGVAAATRALKDPTFALHVMGALVDDRQLDRLIGQLVTGKEDPDYVTGDADSVDGD